MFENRFEAFAAFEVVFDEVMKEKHLSGWWELFDSEDFAEVERRIAAVCGVSNVHDAQHYDEWAKEMADDL